jgi:hypothetical protein
MTDLNSLDQDKNNHALTIPKMTPMSSHVFAWGCPPARDIRVTAAARNPTASTAKMYLAITAFARPSQTR